jgi:hypothetical protein
MEIGLGSDNGSRPGMPIVKAKCRLHPWNSTSNTIVAESCRKNSPPRIARKNQWQIHAPVVAGQRITGVNMGELHCSNKSDMGAEPVRKRYVQSKNKTNWLLSIE